MVALLLAAAALAAAPTINLDKLMAKPTTQVRSQTKVPILLPKRMPVPTADTKLFASATAGTDRYAFRLTSVKDCAANYCFAASFGAERGGRVVGKLNVTLAKGRRARFDPMSCGASCAPARIVWKERGATYAIEALIAQDRNPRQAMIGMANEAIKRGPR